MTTAETLITEHLDIWSSTIKAKKTTGRGSKKKQELYGIKKLRELILDLAVRGLLVAQDPNDEIQKISSSILETEPFRTPKAWQWLKLSEISNINGGFAFKSSNYSIDGTRVIRISDFDETGLKDHKIVRHEYLSEHKKYRLEKSNIIMAMTGGTVGKSYLLQDIYEPMIVNQRVATIKIFSSTSAEYIDCVVKSTITQNAINDSKNSTNDNISMSFIKSFAIPLPPLAEQHRIVAKVDELMALCDQLEQQQEDSLQTHQTLVKTLLAALTTTSDPAQFQQAWQRIATNFDTLFTTEASIDQLKQTILQLAVTGKLVPQNPNDELAEQIIEKIILERDQLIRDKKIPKAKKLSAPRDNPFILPFSWRWTQLGSITHLIEYGTSQKSNDDTSSVPVYRMGDIQGGALYDEKLKFVPQNIDDLPRLFLEPGDILFNRTNSAELVGKAAIFNGTLGTHTFASYLIRVRVPSHFLNPEFINLSILAPYFRKTQIEPEIIQQCGQANFNGTKLAHTLFPIPPIAEQHRIVDKVNELMTLCDHLKAKLNTAQETQVTLTDTISQKAFAGNSL